MTLAIHTRYVPATDTRGARIRASCTRLNRKTSVMAPFDHALDGAARHAAVARALIESKPGFTRDWPDTSFRYCGETADGKGYVFSVGATVE
jgi:hypothetical protein